MAITEKPRKDYWLGQAPSSLGGGQVRADHSAWWGVKAPAEFGGELTDPAKVQWWRDHAPDTSWQLGLDHWWPMTESSGNRVCAVRGTVLTPVGTVGTQAGPGGGLAAGFVFADSANLELATSPSTLDLTSNTQPWTVQLWLKVDSNSVNKRFMWKSDGALSEFMLSDAGAGNQAFFVQGTGTGLLMLPTVTLGTWTHYLFSRNGALRRVRVNDATTVSGSDMPTSVALQNKLWISKCGGAHFWTGAVSRFAKWNRLLNSDEERALFNGGSPPQYP